MNYVDPTGHVSFHLVDAGVQTVENVYNWDSPDANVVSENHPENDGLIERVGFQECPIFNGILMVTGVGETVQASRAILKGAKQLIKSEAGFIRFTFTPRQLNQLKSQVLSGQDIRFVSKEEALEFIERKFPIFKQESAGSRSKEGWHFDSHPLDGSDEVVEHINIYSKESGFRVHITWGE